LWVASAASALKPSGTLTIIHRPDRRSEILSFMQNAFGDVEILPLLPKKEDKPKRMILRARKDAPFSVKECRPLVLHNYSGKYTEEAEAILRHGKEIIFRAA
jgi:tRNA1(Val) A37 N6-methylase TrmN6